MYNRIKRFNVNLWCFLATAREKIISIPANYSTTKHDFLFKQLNLLFTTTQPKKLSAQIRLGAQFSYIHESGVNQLEVTCVLVGHFEKEEPLNPQNAATTTLLSFSIRTLDALLSSSRQSNEGSNLILWRLQGPGSEMDGSSRPLLVLVLVSAERTQSERRRSNWQDVSR